MRLLRNLFLSSIFISLAVVYLQAAAGASSQGEVQALIKQLNSDKETVRLKAVVALGDLGREARAAIPALIAVLKTGNEDFRLNACLALGRIGKDAIGPVARLVNDKDPGLRFYACWTLGLIGPDARRTTVAVTAALKDKDDGVRRKAAYALSRINAKVEAAAPALVEALADPNADVRAQAAVAVKSFGARAVPFLAEGMRKHAGVRAPAVAVLHAIPADGEVVVDAFVPLLREKEAAVQRIAGDALTRHGKAALPHLLDLLKDKDHRVRLEGFRLLTMIPANSAVMLHQLKSLAAANDPSLRESAVALFARLGPKGVPHLVNALSDRDAGVRWTAAFSLGGMRPAAQSAVPALVRAAEDADPDVRASAKDALRKIRSKR